MLIKNVDNNTPIIRLSNKTKIANRMTKLRERERESQVKLFYEPMQKNVDTFRQA